MKTKLLPFLLLLPFVFSNQESIGQETLLFKIQKKKNQKKASYIYGTIHIADKRAYNFNDEVMPAFNSCKTFAMEMIPDAGAMIKVMSLMMMKDQTLKDIFSEEEYSQLEKYFKDSVGQPLSLFNKFKPFFVASMMMQGQYNSEMEQALDLWFYSEAKKQKKEVHGLESMEEQMSVIDGMSMEDQKNMVMSMLDENSADDDMSDKLLDFYVAGELDSISALITRYQEDMGPEFESEFLTKRNYLMVERMLPIIQESPTFIAVGAAHLPGEEGILNLLQKEGYTITPLK